MCNIFSGLKYLICLPLITMNKVLKFEIEAPGGNSIYANIFRLWWTLVAHYYTFKTFFKEFSASHRRFDWRRNTTKDGSVAVLTGGTGGIGAEVVKKLLQCHVHVIMGCRDVNEGNNVVKNIRQKGITTGTAEVLYLDLMSLNSVKEFAFKLLNRNTSVNILINNAGIMKNSYAITVDGLEQHFQVNYLSHYLLTYLLLPRLKKCGSFERISRIINISSIVHYGASPNFSDLQMSKYYSCHKAYMDSKFLQVAFSNYLDSRLVTEGCYVRSYSLHPGIVVTNLWNEWRWTDSFRRVKNYFFLKPEQAADTIAFTSISAQLEKKGGIFLNNSETIESSKRTHNSKTQRKLWKMSCRYLNIDDYAFTYHNHNENAPDNFNSNVGDCNVSEHECVDPNPRNNIKSRLMTLIESVQLIYPFNSKYIKTGTKFVINKIERMRSAFYFLSNYE